MNIEIKSSLLDALRSVRVADVSIVESLKMNAEYPEVQQADLFKLQRLISEAHGILLDMMQPHLPSHNFMVK